jgi:hypothetical protein
MLSAEWLSAIVVVALVALFAWRSGAPSRQIALIAGIVALGIAATALFWTWATRGFD